MEIPRTASTTVDRFMRKLYPASYAPYQKHWPLAVPDHEPSFFKFTTVRNPYSRAVSCWQFFTAPSSISFFDWLRLNKTSGFVDGNIEARPQSFWYDLATWDFVLRQETLRADIFILLTLLQAENPASKTDVLPHMNAIGSSWLNRVGRKTTGLRDKPWYDFYEKNTEELVQEIYAADFKKLGYTLDFNAAASV
jgi:hypothetical protein